MKAVGRVTIVAPCGRQEIALEIMMSRNKPNIGKRTEDNQRENRGTNERDDSWTGTGPKPRGPLNSQAMRPPSKSS